MTSDSTSQANPYFFGRSLHAGSQGELYTIVLSWATLLNEARQVEYFHASRGTRNQFQAAAVLWLSLLGFIGSAYDSGHNDPWILQLRGQPDDVQALVELLRWGANVYAGYEDEDRGVTVTTDNIREARQLADALGYYAD